MYRFFKKSNFKSILKESRNHIKYAFNVDFRFLYKKRKIHLMQEHYLTFYVSEDLVK